MFIVPAYRRFRLTRICLTQLDRTCAALRETGLQADALVLADDQNLEVAADLGMGYMRSPNTPLGAKVNDGFEQAAEWGVDYVVPFGTDDAVDWRVLRDSLPDPGTITCFRQTAVVSEDGTRLAHLKIDYDGGDGVRVFPTSLLEPLGYRPAGEDRMRAIDGSISDKLKRTTGRRPRYVYRDQHPIQIVEFKSPREQLNRYGPSVERFAVRELDNALDHVADIYPELAEDMRGYYRSQKPAAETVAA